ncbi:MAG: transcriptional regulator GutM [Bacillus sp. (in: firmicutes)]
MQMYMIMIFIAGAFLLQMALGYWQIKHFTKAYIELRKIGKVAIGKRPGKFQAGTIVMFAVNNSGIIIKAKKMQGVTVLAKFRDLNGFTNKNIKQIDENEVAHCNRLLKQAILDAASNYKIIMSGGEIPEKNSLFRRMIMQAEKVVSIKKS